MRYYTITSTKNGEDWYLKSHHISEQSLRGLRAVLGRDGVTINAEYAYSIPDRAVWRKATEAELAGGSPEFVYNEKFE